MGTGIVSILLHNLPYNTEWIRWISVGFFALNVLLMVSFTTISVARYVLYPQIWGVMIRHPTQSLFLGTFPMGLASEFLLARGVANLHRRGSTHGPYAAIRLLTV